MRIAETLGARWLAGCSILRRQLIGCNNVHGQVVWADQIVWAEAEHVLRPTQHSGVNVLVGGKQLLRRVATGSMPEPAEPPHDHPDLLPPPAGPALSYSDKCLGDQGVRALCTALATRRDVTSLDLRGCHVHSAGAAAVSQLLLSTGGRGLSAVSLEWNALGTSDAGPRAMARALAANCALTHLDLRNNRIGSAAIASLAEGLQHNSTLVTFDLRWNSAGPSGAHALEAALTNNGSLLRLLLQGNRVPEDALRRIERLLARNGASHAAAAGLPGSSGHISAAGISAGLPPLPSGPPPAERQSPSQVHLHLHAQSAEDASGQLRALPSGGVPGATSATAERALGGVGSSANVSAHATPSLPVHVTPMREMVHSRTLENALVVQHAEFSNKLKHAHERAEAAEETLGSERSRAEVAGTRASEAVVSEVTSTR